MASLTTQGASESESKPRLPLARYHLRFETMEPLRLPAYAGSAWRGALGHALKRTVCVTRLPTCPECLLYRSCAFPYLFETPPPLGSAKMRLYTAAPHPFVLAPPASQPELIESGEPVDLGLTVIGRGNAYLPYLVHAFARAGEDGLGHRRSRLRLQHVEQDEVTGAGGWVRIYAGEGPMSALPVREPVTPPAPTRARIELHTPLRIQHEGCNVTPDSFRFADLFGSLLRRLSMLTYFHTDTPLDTDFAGLTRRAATVSIDAPELAWKDWTRYSSRQGTTMEMGGIIGRLEIALAGIEDLWPYLWLGQYTHAGKGTTMGLGRYTIEPASLPSLQDAAD